ncbi:hypothetical protein PFISCL1PPCAC_14362, partial [Pristionchus fissidentatus]
YHSTLTLFGMADEQTSKCRCRRSWNKILTFTYAILFTVVHALLVWDSIDKLTQTRALAPLVIETALTSLFASAAIGVLLKSDRLMRLFKWTLFSCGSSVIIIFTAYAASEIYDMTTKIGEVGDQLNSLLRVFLFTVIAVKLFLHANETTDKYSEELREKEKRVNIYHLVKSPEGIVFV